MHVLYITYTYICIERERESEQVIWQMISLRLLPLTLQYLCLKITYNTFEY